MSILLRTAQTAPDLVVKSDNLNLMRQTGEMQDTIRLANADCTFLQLKRLVLLCEYVVV